MEVKDAIESIKYYMEFYRDNFVTESDKLAMGFDLDKFESDLVNIRKEENMIVSLLKSLETTINGYEIAYTKAVLEKNKLEKENKAYKGMWGWLSVKWGCFILDNNSPTDFTLDDEMNLIEEKYLGGK